MYVRSLAVLLKVAESLKSALFNLCAGHTAWIVPASGSLIWSPLGFHFNYYIFSFRDAVCSPVCVNAELHIRCVPQLLTLSFEAGSHAEPKAGSLNLLTILSRAGIPNLQTTCPLGGCFGEEESTPEQRQALVSSLEG